MMWGRNPFETVWDLMLNFSRKYVWKMGQGMNIVGLGFFFQIYVSHSIPRIVIIFYCFLQMYHNFTIQSDQIQNNDEKSI